MPQFRWTTEKGKMVRLFDNAGQEIDQQSAVVLSRGEEQHYFYTLSDGIYWLVPVVRYVAGIYVVGLNPETQEFDAKELYIAGLGCGYYHFAGNDGEHENTLRLNIPPSVIKVFFALAGIKY